MFSWIREAGEEGKEVLKEESSVCAKAYLYFFKKWEKKIKKKWGFQKLHIKTAR